MRILVLAASAVLCPLAVAQAAFDVASIRPSSQAVAFERDGAIRIANGTLSMRDVTALTCIKWAYRVQQPQVIWKEKLDQVHYDITAKAPPGATVDQMRAMMQTLLAERFGLKFHRDHKEMDAFALTVSPRGLKMQLSSDPNAEAGHQNSDSGVIAHNFSMDDFVAYWADPLRAPLVDQTGLKGRYDFKIDFRAYVDESPDIRPDPVDVTRRALEGELGLVIRKQKVVVPVLVLEAITPPTAN